jgi:hypothetical protein
MASSSQSGAQCQRQFPRAGEPYHLTAFYQELEAADAFDISQIISSDNEVDVLYNDLLSADSLMDSTSALTGLPDTTAVGASTATASPAGPNAAAVWLDVHSCTAADHSSSAPLAAAPNPLTLSRQPSAGAASSGNQTPLQAPAFVLDLLSSSSSDSLQRFVVQDSSPAGAAASKAATPRRAPRHSKRASNRATHARRAQMQTAACSKAGAARAAALHPPELPPAQATMSGAPPANPAAAGGLRMDISRPPRHLLLVSPFSGATVGAVLTSDCALSAALSFAAAGQLHIPAASAFAAAPCADAAPVYRYDMAQAAQQPPFKCPVPLAVPASSSSADGSSSNSNAGSWTGLRLPALMPPAALQDSTAAGTAPGGHWQQRLGDMGLGAGLSTSTAAGQGMAAERQAWPSAATAGVSAPSAPGVQSAAQVLALPRAPGYHTLEKPHGGCGLYTACGAAPRTDPTAGCGGLLPHATAQLQGSFQRATGTAQWMGHAQGTNAASMCHSPIGYAARGNLESASSSSLQGLTQLDSKHNTAAAGATEGASGGWGREVRLSATPAQQLGCVSAMPAVRSIARSQWMHVLLLLPADSWAGSCNRPGNVHSVHLVFDTTVLHCIAQKPMKGTEVLSTKAAPCSTT